MTQPNPKHAELRILLVQIRESDEVARHEMNSLMDVTGLPESSIWTWNVVSEGELKWERVAAADGVIIGGAGVHSATHDDDFTGGLIDTVRRLADDRKPTFGSCFGHQFIARALGGEVITDEEHSEVGCYDVELLEACEGDDVFGHLWSEGKRTFPALMGHRDRVRVLPDQAIELAKSQLSGNQAFRIADRPIWATQFHAELTPERLIERLERYADIYAPGDNTLHALEEALRPVDESASLVRRFLDVCARDQR